MQTILAHDRMDAVIDTASRFAVAHCPCRVEAQLIGRPCGHPLEVCLKFDEMAEYLILENELAVMDEEWCIGCGVCATRCEYDALSVRYRQNQAGIPPDFETLHRMIHNEREGKSR